MGEQSGRPDSVAIARQAASVREIVCAGSRRRRRIVLRPTRRRYERRNSRPDTPRNRHRETDWASLKARNPVRAAFVPEAVICLVDIRPSSRRKQAGARPLVLTPRTYNAKVRPCARMPVRTRRKGTHSKLPFPPAAYNRCHPGRPREERRLEARRAERLGRCTPK